MKNPTIFDVLARRFKAAWLDYSIHRHNGDAELSLAALRRWSRLLVAFDKARPAAAAPVAAPPAFELHPTDDGGAQVAVPVPVAIRRDLDSCPWRMHLDGQIGMAWGILAFSYHDHDPELQEIGRDELFQAGRNLSPLANFARQPLALLHLSLSPVAWQNYKLAAYLSGVPVDRLLAAVILRRWTEGLFAPHAEDAIHDDLLHLGRSAA